MEGREKLVDELTGIYNLKGFYKATEELFAKNPDKKYIIAHWDVQRFKVINELFGRNAGDAILKDMADKIRTAYKGVEGTYGRMESDNFVACFPAELLEGSREFVHSGEIIYNYEGAEYRFAACYGLYVVTDRSIDIASMVDRSRIAMDTVKANYVKPFAYYDESMREHIVKEQMLMSDCDAAIREKQFEVYYQPVCNASDGTIISAEALVRWRHPEKGLIAPDVFIPLFERNGYIHILDKYIWDRVCAMLKRRCDQGLDVVPISTNVSQIDFYNKNLCGDIIEIVEKYELDPQLLRLEVTESAYADDPQKVREIVEELQDYGFTILMDDFGSGYSSFNTLKDLPVDILKIDMKFMDDLEKGGKSAIILESIVRMTKWMSLRAVAEGVETEEELNFLKSIECNYIQGYYFYRPMPEREFEDLLNDPALVDIKSAATTGSNESDFSILYSESLKSEGVFQNMLGGLSIYERVDDRMEVVRVNKGYYEMMKVNNIGMAAEERLIGKYMEEEDYRGLLEKCVEAEKTSDTVHTQIRRKRYDGEEIWLDARIRFLGDKGKRKMYYFYLMDITAIKKAEEEVYRNRYSKALFRVFDKVYRLDYDSGYAEVLHSVDADMKEGDRIYYRDFFDKFQDSIVSKHRGEYSDAMKDKKVMDRILSESRSGGLSVDYKINNPEKMGFEWVSATFFKVEIGHGEEHYLVCIKRI